MKSIIVAVFLLGLSSVSVKAADHDYQCIADSLQAINNDIYYNLSSTDIDIMLTIPEMMGHIDAINAAKRCDAPKACNGNFEAQFIGKAQNVDLSYAEAGNVEHTTFGVGEFTHYQANQLCPLDEATALKARIWVQGILTLQNGDAVSGVLVYNPKFNMFSIE
ncbi:MAG: hypothetical protein H7177_06480 [Rhizobacter sp.]|nr:hypothetical protein [Bacteriovorax sp.]